MAFPEITAYNMPVITYRPILHSTAYYRHDQDEGGPFMYAASVWLRGPRQEAPLTRNYLKVFSRTATNGGGNVEETASVVTVTIPTESNLSQPLHLLAPLAEMEPLPDALQESKIDLVAVGD